MTAKHNSKIPTPVGPHASIDFAAHRILNAPRREPASAASKIPSHAPTSNPRSSYRRQTTVLIDELDQLLDLPQAGCARLGKPSKPRPARSKPRARNLVLRQAVDLIWKLQCDEQVPAEAGWRWW